MKKHFAYALSLATCGLNAIGHPQASEPSDDNASRVSIQIDNPDAQTAVRVLLDKKLVFEGKPEKSPVSNIPVLLTSVGSFALGPGVHTLEAEVPSKALKAALQWTPATTNAGWIVIRLQLPTANADLNGLAFLTFSLQRAPSRLR